jgi:hypothetical protein
VVQHQAAGAFEEAASLLVPGQVQHAAYDKPRVTHDRVDDFLAPLIAAVLGMHGVQHDRAVRMEAHPVVGEHRVGLDGPIGILGHAYRHALRGQRGGEGVEFGQRAIGNARGLPGVLKTVGTGGLRVVAEVPGPDHQDGAGTLKTSSAPDFPSLHYRLLHLVPGRHNSRA